MRIRLFPRRDEWRRVLRRWSILVAVAATFSLLVWTFFLRMPGRSHAGPLPPLDADTDAIRGEVASDVRALAGEIGERNVVHLRQLEAAAAHVERSFSTSGLAPRRQTVHAEGVVCSNVIAEVAGSTRAAEIVVVGAHYDSVVGSPGANDNATGVAATLALARRLAASQPARTVRFVGFVNEESPWFQSDAMGSLVYAKSCAAARDDVRAMLSLETLGCFSDVKGSQKYPLPGLSLAYPSRGNYIAFVGNGNSRALAREACGTFRANCAFPSEGAALPDWIAGIGWSDHWAFWQIGVPAIMATDTAPFRYPWYHTAEDTPDKVDFERLARVTSGLVAVVRRLANPEH